MLKKFFLNNIPSFTTYFRYSDIFLKYAKHKIIVWTWYHQYDNCKDARMEFLVIVRSFTMGMKCLFLCIIILNIEATQGDDAFKSLL